MLILSQCHVSLACKVQLLPPLDSEIYTGGERMFAIIQTGGKQYKVAENDEIKVEKLDLEVGKNVDFDALLVSDNGKVKTGTPVVKGVKVVAEVVEHGKADKILVYKYKAKKNVRSRQGHRQPWTKLKIVKIG